MSKQVERMMGFYGDAGKDPDEFQAKHMGVFHYPQDVLSWGKKVLGEKIYCNKDFWPHWLKFLRLLFTRNLHLEIRSYGGCYNNRSQRGAANLLSMHAFGCAVDLNVADNPRGKNRQQLIKAKKKPFTERFIQAAIDAGLTPGANFSVPDLMHFEYTKGPVKAEAPDRDDDKDNDGKPDQPAKK